MSKSICLGIDFGAQTIGVALVRTEDDANTPLFAGTITYDPVQLKKKLSPRPQLRRLRRTRKTKHNRLRTLSHALKSLGLPNPLVQELKRFCKRRGWKSLFGNGSPDDDTQESSEDEIVFRYTREEFFEALEYEIQIHVPSGKRLATRRICEKVLNRLGDPHNEVRLVRIDNRGASRCAWEGCNSVTPRRENAIRDALAQFVFLVCDRDKLRDDPDLLDDLNKRLDQLAILGKRLRNVGGHNQNSTPENQVKTERKALLKRVRIELSLIKDLSGDDTWTTNRSNIMNILERSKGRNRYCREHSKMFVEHTLTGKAIPFKASLTEKDLVSRREEVLLQKLWRYLEARVLPLAPEGIDQVVVERVAFDLLAGSMKQRTGTSDKVLEEMYQQGPQYGFKNDLEMLKTEFGGLCVYCGEKRITLLEREHILPRSDFIFDGYLNLVPACPECNRQIKSAHSPGSVGLTIHPKAFEAYEKYLSRTFRTKAPHHLHTVKKGILKLMTQSDRTWEAEQYLALIAKNYVNITGTQRGPRPMARYLAGKLGNSPKIKFHNGRHTALWREVAYPQFDKVKDKVSGSTINHAVDALILASKLPTPTILEGKNLPVKSMKAWASNVRKAAPPAGPDGIPQMPYPSFAVPGFEDILPGNYIQTNLSFLNWNSRDSRVQRQDIYGWNHNKEIPTRRTAAADLVDALIQADKEKSESKRLKAIRKVLDNIIHPQLKSHLEATYDSSPTGEACANAMIDWLRKSIGGSLEHNSFSRHPADQRRKATLEAFIGGKSDSVPVTIGISMLRPHDTGAVDLERVNGKGTIIHRYRSDPANIAKIVGYRFNGDSVSRQKPVVFNWRQNWQLAPTIKSVPAIPDGPLQGRAYGEQLLDKNQWVEALEKYLVSADISEYVVVQQGCVVQYEDGSEQYIRNFSSTQGFKAGMLKNIVSVRRTPFVDTKVPNAVIG